MRRAVSLVLALALLISGAAFVLYVLGEPLPAWQSKAVSGGAFMSALGAIWLDSDITGAA
jgi:hypothetical protein